MKPLNDHEDGTLMVVLMFLLEKTQPTSQLRNKAQVPSAFSSHKPLNPL